MGEVEQAAMTGSGVEATGWGDELAIMEHALQHLAQVVVALDGGFGEGAGILGDFALAQGLQQALAMLGVGGGMLLGDGVLVLTEPEQDGLVFLVRSDEQAQGSRAGSQAVFGAVQ